MKTTVIIKLLIGLIYGALAGVVVIPVSKRLILKRSDDPGDIIFLNKKASRFMLPAIGVVAGAAVALTAGDSALLVRNLLFVFPMFSIAVVDSLIKKIPNPLLLLMIIIQGVYVAYYCVANNTTSLLLAAGFGFFIGFLCCTIPSVLKIPVGAGDVKYSAVIGLCIFFMSYMQAMIIMGLLALVAYIILKATKKGDMKTLIPMGPFLSAGAVISMCFPLLEKLLSEVGMF